jgi:hypothetical protein
MDTTRHHQPLALVSVECRERCGSRLREQEAKLDLCKECATNNAVSINWILNNVIPCFCLSLFSFVSRFRLMFVPPQQSALTRHTPMATAVANRCVCLSWANK